MEAKGTRKLNKKEEQKMRLNNKGIGLIWLIVWILITGGIIAGVSQVYSERKVLAEDIKSGRLILTPSAQEMIAKGDLFLNDAGRRTQYGNYKTDVTDNDLYSAFIAK